MMNASHPEQGPGDFVGRGAHRSPFELLCTMVTCDAADGRPRRLSPAAPSPDLPQFWLWTECVIAYALLTNRVHTMFGWELQLTDTWKRPLAPELSDAKQRRRNAPGRLLHGDRCRRPDLRPDP